MHTIVIGDSDTTYMKSLVNEFKCRDATVLGSADNGQAMMSLVRRYRPSIVILSLIMPVYDGYYVLDELMKERIVNNYFPKIAVISSISYGKMKDRAISYGIDYYFFRTLTPKCICNTLLADVKCSTSHCAEMNSASEEVPSDTLYISRILHDLGVPAHIKGYGYVREAILICQNNSKIYAITRDIYPLLAEKFDTTPSRVERAIRHAFSVAWERGNMDKFDAIFNRGYKDIMADKPTNGEFVFALSQILRLKTYEVYC